MSLEFVAKFTAETKTFLHGEFNSEAQRRGPKTTQDKVTVQGYGGLLSIISGAKLKFFR